jgi:aminoglycoside 2'-N-acetyltransferase I
MAELRIAHTADLDPATLKATRALLDDVFQGDMTDQDWEHALGGVHALVSEGAELIGHASLVQRRMLHGGRALRTRATWRASGCARTGEDADTARP